MRGVTSHFNEDTVFDQILFGLMGLMIGITTMLLGIYFFTLFIGKSSISGPYRLSVLLGIIIFLAASGIGGMMISKGSHTIGAADGSRGILFFNWSKTFGDLRIAHFIGLHAIQIIPMSCYLLLSKTNSLNIVYILLTVLFLAYSYTVYAMYTHALSGFPLFFK